MKNLFYYLKKNGSLSFREYALNEVDGLILCQLAYINWDKFLRFDDEVNMVSLFNEENYNVITKDTIFEKKNLKLIKLLRKIPRYQDVKVTHLVNTLCYEDESSFSL